VVFNKIDTLSADEVKKKLIEFKKATGVEPLAISAVSGKGIEPLLFKLGEVIFTEQI
jgi:GTP-binding protein